MKLIVAFGFVALALITDTKAAVDVRRPPTPAERQSVTSNWSESSEAIRAALMNGYLPGGMGRSGSTGNAAFRAWLTLWKWTHLMSSTSQESALELFGRHLYVEEGESKPIFVGPGLVAPDHLSRLKPSDLAGLTAQPSIQEDLFRRLVPEPIPLPTTTKLGDELDPDFIKSMTANPRWLDLLFSTLSDNDYAPGVLWNLQSIWKANPSQFDQYFNLALALAVVYDQKRPSFWPHPQVKADLVPVVERPVTEWFDFWVAANEGRALLLDLKQQAPSDLKFVVDAPLAQEEYEWALRNVKFPRASFEKAFSSVPYNRERIQTQEFVWKDSPYLLKTIQKGGGICVDQAYFAMVAGKARGLPTLFFSGQGTDGGHAWFGYLKSADRWDMDCGRYENQNYAVGEALDPQSWLPISDHELKSLTEKFRSKPDFTASQDDILMAKLLEESGTMDKAGKAFDSAVSVSMRNPDAWQEKGSFLQRSGANVSVRKAFHQAAVKQFETQRDVRIVHQMELAALLRESGDIKAAEILENQVMSQNKNRRSDISVNAATQRLKGLMAEKKTEDALREYRRLLTSLKRTGGGAFFYDVALPFAEALASEGYPSQAKDVLIAAQKALRPESGSILDQDLEKAIQSFSR